jgi:hypothetical protein
VDFNKNRANNGADAPSLGGAVFVTDSTVTTFCG